MPTAQALALAQERGLDLVEVAPTAVPPVCRILDYGQYKYELQKREREQKKKQKSQTFKEVRLGVKVDVHDLQTKARRAAQFLDHGDRVKITVRFRGREISHANLGRDLLMRTAELLAEHGAIERQPLLEGRSMYIVMGPLEKRPEKRDDGDGSEPSRTKGDDGGNGPSGTTESTEPPKGGETIGDAIAAKAPPAPAASPAEAAVETPAAKGS